VLRIFQYPLVIGVLEAAQVICFAVAASQLRARCTGQWQLLGLFVLFPCTFFGVNFGAGWPTIIALHLENSSTAVIAAGTVVSIGFAVVLVQAAASFLPQRLAGDAEDRASIRATTHTQPVSGKVGVAGQDRS
jgi:ABC-type spermidine/putrescine transport system permease subunit II